MPWARAPSPPDGRTISLSSCAYFNVNIPLWLAYDHWTGMRAAQDIVARQMTKLAHPELAPGTQAFLQAMDALKHSGSPDLRSARRYCSGRRTSSEWRLASTFRHSSSRSCITWVLVVGIKESARFNATIVAIKVTIVLFVIVLGIAYVNRGNWGTDWHSFAPYGFSGIGAGAAYIFFAYIGFDAVSTTAQEAKNPQRDLPIAIITSLVVCTVLYILVAAVLTGMVPWREINIEAPIARAFLGPQSRLGIPYHHAGALAGLTSVMLVMLLGQTRVLYAMANDGLLPRKFFSAIHPQVPHSLQEHNPGGIACRHRRQRDADRRHRQDGQYRHLAGLRDRLHCHHDSAPHKPGSASPVPHSPGCRSSRSWACSLTAT